MERLSNRENPDIKEENTDKYEYVKIPTWNLCCVGLCKKCRCAQFWPWGRGRGLTLNKNSTFLESNLYENSLMFTTLPPGSRTLSDLDLVPSKSCCVDKPRNTLNKEHIDAATSESAEG